MTIELPTFNGNEKKWFLFWSIFKKLHEDPSIRNKDKFQYLIQAKAPDSRAGEVVCSFPPTAENYIKVIMSLQNRFWLDEAVVEFYVRELPRIVH